MDLQALQSNYQPFNLGDPATKQVRKNSGIKGAFANLLPTIGGAVGAVGGSFLAPVAGTIGGGAAGSALGEALKERLTGEKMSAKNIAVQGALGAVPGVFKGAKVGAQAIKGAKAAKEASSAAEAAAQLASSGKPVSVAIARDTSRAEVDAANRESRFANPLNKTDVSANPAFASSPKSPIPFVTAQDAPQKATLFGKLSTSLTKSGSGIKVGGNVGDINRTDQAAQTFQRLGIKGTPNQQLKKISDTMASHGAKVDDVLAKNPIKVNGGEVKAQVAKAIEDPTKFAELDLSTPGAQRALDAHLNKFASANSAKDINDYIKVLNPIASRAQDKLIRGVTLTDKETAALAAKKSGDEVLSQFPEIKPYKQDMATLFERNPQVAKEAEKTTGIPLLGIKSRTVPQVIDKAKSSLGSGLSNVENAAQSTTGQTARKVGGSLLSQMTTRAVAAPLTEDQSSNNNNMTPSTTGMDQAITPTTTNPMMNDMGSLYNKSGDDASNGGIDYQAEAQKALASGNYKAFDAILQLANLDAKSNAATSSAGYSKPSASQYSQAMGAMGSISQLKDLLGKDNGVVGRNVTPGQGLPGIGSTISNLAGTGVYRALKNNIMNSIARINTGANMPESESKFYDQTYMPQPNDSADVIQTKMNNLEQFFTPILSYSGGGGSDITSLLAGAQ